MIDYSVTKHTLCKIGYIIAGHYGEHMVSLTIDEPTDNGRIVKVGKMTSLDNWEIATDEDGEKVAPTGFKAYILDKAVDGTWLVVVDEVADDKTALIYQQPIINEESPKMLTSLANFYNDPEDGAVRGYILHANDRFYLSDLGFQGVPAKDAEITSISADGKLVIG